MRNAAAKDLHIQGEYRIKGLGNGSQNHFTEMKLGHETFQPSLHQEATTEK